MSGILTFDPGPHKYAIDGKHIPGVSELLDSVGVKSTLEDEQVVWNSISNRFKIDEVAANFGTAFHTCAAWIQKRYDFTPDPQMKPWLAQFRKFLAAHKGHRVVALEQMLGSKTLGFAGTPDRIDRDTKGDYWIWDWKTGEAFCKDWRLQLHAYRLLVVEAYNLRNNAKVHLRSVRFFRDKYRVDDCYDALADNKIRSIRNVYQLKQAA